LSDLYDCFGIWFAYSRVHRQSNACGADEMTGPLKDSHENENKELAYDILRYLRSHPEAGDTLEGIAQWWLLREWAERRLRDVEHAIQLLVEASLVLKKMRPGQEPRYEMNLAKKDEIERILRGTHKR
jgi:hypothetical protein